MITYLVKRTDGQPFHFRVILEGHILNVVEGQFYNWVNKWGKNCVTMENAQREAEQLIQKKIAEGYKIERFKEIKENTVNVYDKAKWHSQGNFPQELNDFQGFVHTGMYVAWLIDHDLLNKENFEDHENVFQEVKKRVITGAEFYEQYMDGVLLLEEVSELGNKFSLDYFDFDTGQYLSDYEKTLAHGLPSVYHVQNNWENYNKLKSILDKRFEKWQARQNKKPFWKLW